MTLVHWDDVEGGSEAVGHLEGQWFDLGSAAGSVTVGVNRIRVPAGKWSTPAHCEGAEEEIFYVLAGSGLSWQDGSVHEVSAGDCLVHLVDESLHTLRAGAHGIDVLAFGQRVPVGGTHLPRAGVVRHGAAALAVRAGEHPWELEAAAGEPPIGEPGERPPTTVATGQVAQAEWTNGGEVHRLHRDLGRAAGSMRTGLKHVTVSSGRLGAAPHCHSAEEELFVVLEGGGSLLLGEVEHSVRAGHVVSRPGGTGVAHAFRAGPEGLVYLAYGTREPSDVCFYPRSQKLFFRGLGVVARVEQVGFWDGEP